ncbi:MAG: DUF899 family protein [Ignavibacteria bacterium]
MLVCPDTPEVHKEFADSRGWDYPTYSAAGTDFIFDMGYDFIKDESIITGSGVSVFEKDDDGKIRRVAKDYFGPGDFYCNIWHFLDLLPNEDITVNS